MAVRTADPTTMLAAFAAELDFDALPAEVVAKAKALMRDGLGNQLAASVVAEPARTAIGLLEEFGGSPQASVTGYDLKLPVPFAALANAMLGHGVELDDAHRDALTKSGSSLVPSAVASGEFRRSSGRETIVALVVGYELMIRIGLAMQPSHRKRGFHTSGTVAAIATAAVAGRQLALEATAMNYALGLGAMQAAGIQAYLDDPCMAKPLSPGKGAFNGTFAAMLAARGFTGPRTALEGREGFFNAYADSVDLDIVTGGLGEEYRILEVAYKPHAACRYAHGPIDAAHLLRAEHGLRLEDVADVAVWTSELAVRQSGRTDVPNLNSAMGSTPFGVAVALSIGSNGLSDYQRAFGERTTHDLCSRIRMTADPKFGVMGRQAVVEVATRDGRTLRKHVDMPKGEPEWPLTDEELHAKFVSLASLALPPERVERLESLVLGVDELEDITPVVEALRRNGS